MPPLYIRVHPADNVAIIVGADGVVRDTVLSPALAALESIPQGHKVALSSIPAGSSIVRYGQAIGSAARAIAPGECVREADVFLPHAPELRDLAFAGEARDIGDPLDGFRFDGFVNDDSSVGTKNVLAIATTVECVTPTVELAVARIKAEIMPRFPSVDTVVALSHGYGCGVAIDAPLADVPIRTLRNLSRNPNLGGGAMLVSLGCEKLQPARLYNVGDCIPAVIRLQDQEYRSFGSMIAAIMRLAEKRLEELDRRRRRSCPASDLVVGLQCGGSDAFSGVTANPAVGFAADLLVRCGATVMFSEVSEVRDAVHLLAPRAINADVGRALTREMSAYDDYLARGGADRSANPTPGNKRGGLANIVEKALGSVAKAGTSPIKAVTAPGERVSTKGLVFAATPASDFICGTLQLAAGMNLHVFTTGEGSPYGLAMAPVIKVSSRTELAERWSDLIDLDAGRIATGQSTVEEVGWELFHLMLEVASGRKKTWADHWGLHNRPVLFNPAPVT